MILTFIITSIMKLTELIFSVLPSLPAMPTEIINGTAWIITSIQKMTSLLMMLFNPIIFTACISTILIALNFNYVYQSIMWIIRKIPLLNIK